MSGILLTGSSGFIGSSLRKRLGRRFYFIKYDIVSNPRDSTLDLNRLKKSVRNIDGIIHLAAISRPKWGYENPYQCLTTNILGIINLLEAVRTVNPKAWVIFGSSREVFAGIKKFPADEKSQRIPLNAYGVSKVCGENLLKQYSVNYGLKCLTLRFCGVYTGKNDILDRVIPRFICQALRGEKVTVEGAGRKKKYDYVHIDDVVRGIELAVKYIKKQKPGFYDDVILAASAPISLYDLARLIIRLTDSKSKIIFGSQRLYDEKGFWASNKKAKKILEWKPHVLLKQGLKRAIEELRPMCLSASAK